MLEQAIHFKEESDALYNLLINADNNSIKLNTQFKSWTINDVLYHLHVWNIAALLSLKNENEFISLEPKLIHRMEAIEDCTYLEASTPEIDDVVRLNDDYDR